jgi:hypothetical protein
MTDPQDRPVAADPERDHRIKQAVREYALELASRMVAASLGAGNPVAPDALYRAADRIVRYIETGSED